MNSTIGGSYAYNYYLSRRTYFGWHNEIYFNKLFVLSRERYNASTRFDFVHWVSPQLRLTGNVGVVANYEEVKFSKNTRYRPNLNLNLRYSIF